MKLAKHKHNNNLYIYRTNKASSSVPRRTSQNGSRNRIKTVSQTPKWREEESAGWQQYVLLKWSEANFTISISPRRITAAFVLSPNFMPSIKPAPRATMFWKQRREADARKVTGRSRQGWPYGPQCQTSNWHWFESAALGNKLINEYTVEPRFSVTSQFRASDFPFQKKQFSV